MTLKVRLGTVHAPMTSPARLVPDLAPLVTTEAARLMRHLATNQLPVLTSNVPLDARIEYLTW